MKSTSKAAAQPGCAICRRWIAYDRADARGAGMTIRLTPRQWVATCQCGREVGRGWWRVHGQARPAHRLSHGR